MSESPKKSSSFFSKIILIPAFIAIVFILFAVARQTYKKTQIQKEIDGLQEKAAQIDKENSDIREKIAYFESKDYQEKEAKDKLNLQNPDENVVIIKPSIAKETQPEESAPSAAPPAEKKIPNIIKWWNYFFGY